jgi:hypothetical protein
MKEEGSIRADTVPESVATAKDFPDRAASLSMLVCPVTRGITGFA